MWINASLECLYNVSLSSFPLKSFKTHRYLMRICILRLIKELKWNQNTNHISNINCKFSNMALRSFSQSKVKCSLYKQWLIDIQLYIIIYILWEFRFWNQGNLKNETQTPIIFQSSVENYQRYHLEPFHSEKPSVLYSQTSTVILQSGISCFNILKKCKNTNMWTNSQKWGKPNKAYALNFTRSKSLSYFNTTKNKELQICEQIHTCGENQIKRMS
jgi:hypothetical protein